MNKNHNLNLRLYKFLPQIIIVALILLIYIQNLWFDFAYLDDNLIVFAEYEKIDSLSKIPNTFLGGYLLDNYYRPMIMISFIIDTAIAGQSSMMYHLTNIILHIIFCILLYTFLLKFDIKKSVSLFCTIVFALHPLNLNSVSWIVGRNDLIVGLFSIISIISFINYLKNTKVLYILIHLAALTLALFSKEIGIMIPIVLVAYIWIFQKQFFKEKRKVLIIVVAWCILAAIYLFTRLFVVRIHPQEQLGFGIFVKNFYILFEYIAKLFYLPGIIPLSIKNITLILIGSSIGILLTTLIIVKRYYKNKIFLWGIFVFFTFLGPSLFVRLQTKDGGFVYLDCRMYLPFVGLLISSAAIINNIKLNNALKIFFSSLFIIYLIVFSFIKNIPYQNGEIFWSEVIKHDPYAPYNYMGLGFYYYDNKAYEKAANCAMKAIELNPTIDEEFYQKAALAYEAAGKLIEANNVLERSLIIDKDNPVTLVNLIKNYLKLKQIDKAKEWTSKFLQLNIKNKKAKSELASSLSYYYAQQNQFQDAVKLMKVALVLYPNNPIYNNDLGVFFVKDGKIDSAEIYFEKAAAIEPNNLDYQKNLNYIKSRLEKAK